MINFDFYKEALLIRRVEEKLLELYSKGKLNGTIHTCVGQEFSPIAFINQLEEDDFIFSNHRCHGHYISYSKDYKGLIAELMGKRNGICGGIGGSQHLFNRNFFSNGIQGGMVPVAAGMSLAKKLGNSKDIGLIFIGDGTLGEGIVYESMNIASKWELPILIVCENNFYAQSTRKEHNLAGDILARPRSFDIKTYKCNTWELEDLFRTAKDSINYVRESCKPAFCLVDTYRLNPHSKGDDNRSPSEIEEYRKEDPLNIFKEENKEIYNKYLVDVDNLIHTAITEINEYDELSIDEYIDNEDAQSMASEWCEIKEANVRQSELIYSFFLEEMKENNKIVFIGEDVNAPYGGAFKVSRDLSEKYPDRVYSTPISEAAITGIANGLALSGFRPFVEIMFGDFITLCMDQIVNHASKFYYMYNKQITCPLVIRTPMGGRRGYGPAHSQTLDKLLLGVDNTTTVVLNELINPVFIYRSILENENNPVFVIENKTDYVKKVGAKRVKNYIFEEKVVNGYPVVRIRPILSIPMVTIITYGGGTSIVLDSIMPLFIDHDLKVEVIVLSKINPIDYEEIIGSVNKTKRLYIVEEGSKHFGIGSEIITSVIERTTDKIVAKRIASLSVPIPSNRNLENIVLTNVQDIINAVAGDA